MKYSALETLTVVAEARTYGEAAARLGISAKALRWRLDRIWKLTNCAAYPWIMREEAPARVGDWSKLSRLP